MYELLMPAGNFKKLTTAFYFGADAVYAGGKQFSLRAFADNFGREDMLRAIKYAHDAGKRLYVTANIYAHNRDLTEAEEYLAFLASAGADAVIVSDVGMLYAVKKAAPGLGVHISTQANTSNKYAVRFYKEQGAERVVLARELNIDEISEIKDYVPDVELECFVHGAMCVGMSGRCLLSDYFIARSGNRGECAQPCRWRYRLTDDDGYTKTDSFVEEDARGTYFMSSKDLNLLRRLPELIKAGVDSFKIEGRMKSEFYIATVAHAYRRALDEAILHGKVPNADIYMRRLEEMAHRPYTEAFFDKYADNTVSYDDVRAEDKYDFIAVAEGYGDGCATVEMRNRFRTGDKLEVLSPHFDDAMPFCAAEIYTSEGELTDDAKLVQHRYRIAVPFEISKGDILRRAKSQA